MAEQATVVAAALAASQATPEATATSAPTPSVGEDDGGNAVRNLGIGLLAALAVIVVLAAIVVLIRSQSN